MQSFKKAEAGIALSQIAKDEQKKNKIKSQVLDNYTSHRTRT